MTKVKYTRGHKLQIGCCEHCGTINVKLDAAHKHKINNTKNNGVLKVGKLVQSSFKDLSNNSKLTTTGISNLQKLDYCKRVFNAGYEVLRKSSRSKLCVLGRTRYYASEVVPGYWLSSEWYETQRTCF